MNNRYSRHISLNEIGPEGQAKLSAAHVCIVGCGGLGSIAAPYLAGAGVGKITLVDGDIPDISNIHRQVFYNGSENISKAQVLSNFLTGLNPDIRVEYIASMLNKENIEQIFQETDLVLDCTDEINTKYLCNDYCHLNHIPLVYASIYKYEGYVSFFNNSNYSSIHLRDIYSEVDNAIPKCSEVGVLNTISGVIGLFQANEALKHIVGMGSNLNDKLLSYDILDNSQHIIKLKKTWKKSIKNNYSNLEYISQISKPIPEISYSKYLKSKSDYNLICILENDEYIGLNQNVVHIPLSKIDVSKWSSPENKICIFYCRTGQRSSSLVAKLLNYNSHQELYSLKDGISSLNQNKSKS